MDVVFKLMDFAFKLMDVVFKLMDFEDEDSRILISY